MAIQGAAPMGLFNCSLRPATAGPTAAATAATVKKDSRRRDFSLYHGVKVRSPRGAGSLLLFVPKRLHLDLPCSKAFQADGGP